MTERNSWIQFLGHSLFLLAAWTLFIKYLFPIGYSLASGESWWSHVYWDLWPLAHIWLGWALLTQSGYGRRLALVMSIIEIVIILSKFAVFLANPEWTIWRSNWFVNKVFVLVCFILVLVTALMKPGWFGGANPKASSQ